MRQNRGSFLLGIIGALLGALVACVPFIIAYRIGYVVFIFAFFFMTFASWGYNKLGGRISYFKIFVVGFFGFSAMILSILSFDIYDLYLFAKESPKYSVSTIPFTIYYAFTEDAAYRSSLIGAMVLPGILTFLSWIFVIVETHKEVSAYKQMKAHNEMAMQNQMMYGNPNGMGMSDFSQPAAPQMPYPQVQPNPNDRNTMDASYGAEETRYEEETVRRPEE